MARSDSSVSWAIATWRTLEGVVWLALLASCVSALLLVKGGSPDAILLMEQQGRLWWSWLALFYVGAASLAGVTTLAVARVMNKARVAGIFIQLLFATVLLASVALNHQAVASLFGGSRTLAAFILAGLGIAAGVVGAAWSRPWMLRGLALLALGSCYLALAPPQGQGVDLGVVSNRLDSSTGERLLVIGVDGADWTIMAPLLERGELPNISRLMESGVWGDLKTMRPTRSAPIWTTVVTGVEPTRHGVVNNSVDRLRGTYNRIPSPFPGPQGLGLPQIEFLLRKLGLIAPSTVASFDRRVPAFWTIATATNTPVDFLNWWASWPAEQSSGRIITDRAYFWRWAAKGFALQEGNITYPDSLFDEISSLLMKPEEVTREHALQFMDVDVDEFEEMKTTPYQHHRLKSEFKYLYSMFASNLRMALYLLESGREHFGQSPDMFVLFRIVDQTCHQALKYSELVDSHLDSAAAEVEKYSRVVTEAYRASDRAIGELIEAFGQGNVVVLSDHGFKLTRRRKAGPSYRHSGSSPPDGIFVAAGPAFRTGRVENLELYDMMPVFMALKGWPVAQDFVRGVPTGVFKESFLEEHPVETIESYGTMTVSLPKEGTIVADDEMVERLRALGYLD